MTDLNPDVLRFVAAFVPLREEPLVSYEGFLWDGKTLATRVNYLCIEDEVSPLSDFDLLHEAAHHFVADPVEREFPDYGCMMLVERGSTGGLQGEDLNRIVTGVLTPVEQEWREVCAYFLGLYWAMHFGVDIPAESQMNFHRNAYMGEYGDRERGWRALIHLHEHGLLG